VLSLKKARIPTHIDGMDRALNGGIPEGHIVLLTGYPGTMKSSLAFSILYHNAEASGKRGVYITLEQSRQSLLTQMEALGLRDPLVGDKIQVIDLSQVRKNLASAKKRAPFLKVFTTYVQNIIGENEIDMLVLDSVDVLETITDWESRRSGLFYLFEIFQGLGTTSFLIDEASMDLGSPHRHREEAYLADGIIDLSLQPVGESEAQRRIRCVKMRWTAHETTSYALLWNGQGFETTRSVTVRGPRV
jgi:KaiC/GvpD/RAD55 family RecA-like ATPase